MTQKFYLRNVTATGAPSTGERSAALTSTQADNATTTEETRSLLSAKGAAQTSIAQTTDATTSAELGYHARFTSNALQAGTYGNGTWTMAMAINEGSANSNFFLAFSIYIWNPAGSVRGFIYDAVTAVGTEPPTAETGEVNNITGANVTATEGDFLVLEVWRTQTQSMGTAYTNTIFFDGVTEPTDGTGTTDAASYINAPADIPEYVAPVAYIPNTNLLLLGVG